MFGRKKKKGAKDKKKKQAQEKGRGVIKSQKKTRKNIVEEMRFEDMDETKKQFQQKNIPRL
jgi:hypothetical protein